mgnify:CR=1 FL=1
MLDVLKAIAVGGLVGAAFAAIAAPIPAPPRLAGVAGILGVLIAVALVFLRAQLRATRWVAAEPGPSTGALAPVEQKTAPRMREVGS